MSRWSRNGSSTSCDRLSRSPRATCPLSISASIGVALGDRGAPEELLRDADIALYRAKAAGKKRAVVFAPSMQAAVDDHRNLGVDLHGALDADQFFLLYQPTIDLQTDAFTGVEALLRWRHPTAASSSPTTSSRHSNRAD